MSLSTSLLAYEDCIEAMDQAVAATVGVRVRVPDSDAAYYFRMRCHTARKLDREQNKVVFDAEHPMHGRSEYDRLTLTILTDAEGTWVVFRKVNIEMMEIQPLEATNGTSAPANRGIDFELVAQGADGRARAENPDPEGRHGESPTDVLPSPKGLRRL